ncbi:MAG: transcription antitermination factor NusB [Polyangia bacterium]
MAIGGAGPRRRAREIALQILIQMDVNPELDATRAIRLYFDHLAEDGDGEADEPQAPGAVGSPAFDQPFVQELVAGVAARQQELDEIVQNLSRNWRIERMALVERNVIRVALHEMKFTTATPTNVAINEAVELAKRFGTAEGAAFVNGLLDRAATELQLRR